MRLVADVVLDVLKVAARERLIEAAHLREAYIRGRFKVHAELADTLEAEAAEIKKALEVILALSLQ